MQRMGHKQALDAIVKPKGLVTVDVGCGNGGMVRHLTRQGAEAVGVEPNASQLTAAKDHDAVGQERYVVGSGEALPFEDASVDVVLYLNSFHHLPSAVMPPALGEAARILRPGRGLIVVEPLAEGLYFETLRPLEDETAVRAEAYEVLKRPPLALKLQVERCYEVALAFKSVAAFISRVVAADPARKERLSQVEEVLSSGFKKNAVMDGERFLFYQPARMMVFDRTA